MNSLLPIIARAIAVVALISNTAFAETTVVRNLVSNGTFEQGDASGVAPWKLDTNEAGATVRIDEGRRGGRALRLDYPTRVTSFDAKDPLRARPLAIRQAGIPLNVSDPYSLVFWIRGENIHSQSVTVSMQDRDGAHYKALQKTVYAAPGWQRHEFNFQWWLNKAPESAEIEFSLSEHGTVWIDDIEIVCRSPETPRMNPQLSRTGGRNLVPNGSFEVGRDGWSSLGKNTGWGGNLTGLVGEIVKGAARDGESSLRIELGEGKSPVTFYDCWPMARVVQSRLLAANRGWIAVTPGETYTLSAFMKANRPGVGGRLLVRHGKHADKTPPAARRETEHKDVVLGERWESHTFTFTAQSPQVCIAVGPELTDANNNAATVWVDAIQLELGASATEPSSSEPIEVGFDFPSQDNVLEAKGPAAIQVKAKNFSRVPANIELHGTVRDYFGKVVARPMINLGIAAEKVETQTWSLGELGQGYFTLTVERTGSNASRELRFAILEPYPHRDSIFGVNHAPVTAELGRRLQRAGIKWARDWSLNWGQLEPEKGKLSFDASDAQIDRLREEGYSVVTLLPPLPSADWASSAPDSVKAELWLRMAYMPKDRDELWDFMRKAIAHNRNRVRVWEFLNEPIWTGFCLPQPDFNKPGANYTPADYVKLLKSAYRLIKTADPEGRVIGGFAAQPWHYSRDFVELGGLESVDIFNIHNYGTYRAPEELIGDMKSLLKLMDDNGGRKPIWLTEYSYYGIDEFPWEPWTPPSTSWSANLLLRDERQCADWSLRYNIILLAHGVEKIFYHSGHSGEINDGLSYLECALIADNGEPRKLYAAQSALAQMLGPDCKFAREMRMKGERPGIYGYAFQCGARAVMPVWATEATAKSQRQLLKLPEGAHVFDAMGNRLPRDRAILGTSPVYVVSTSIPADRLATACTLSSL